jgi:FkbM family methyltransferase
MIRDLGSFAPKRASRLDHPILSMLLNGLHDHHRGQVFVLQVGAGTGTSALPLFPRFRDEGWSGLLIEPLPRTFAQLETLHTDSDRVAVLNLGISDASSNLTLYALTPEADARYRRGPLGRASLSRDRIAPAALSDDEIASLEVPFLRMDTVLTELGIDSAQLLAVNAGGHEAEVLSSFGLAGLDPSLVLVHSAAGTASDARCIAILREAGLLPFRVADWLVGLAPDRLAVPLEELLTFFRRGPNATEEAEE